MSPPPPSDLTADLLIEMLELLPHPEGGFYRETYRAPGTIAAEALPGRFGGARAYSTAIYFLLRGDQFSALHRLRCDELWHFYLGAPLELIEITGGGRLVVTRLGPALTAGEVPQAAVPAGHWFGARLAERRPDAFALVGCTVAPGFDFADFEMARRDDMLAAHPRHESLIRALTRPGGS
ncbi:MAG: cupin domain-containing protein [Planctomycetota bacterium]|jgi:predicted cupin superfamily sugar epimerase